MAANAKDYRWRQLPNHIIFTIFICFIIPFLKSNISLNQLNSTRIFHQKRRPSKSTDVTWRHQPLFGPFFVPSFWDISLRKKQLFMDGQNSRNVLGDTLCKFRIVNPFTARVNNGVLYGNSSLRVECGRNPIMLYHWNETSLPVRSHDACF